MLKFSFKNLFKSVDFPTFGLPQIATNIDFLFIINNVIIKSRVKKIIFHILFFTTSINTAFANKRNILITASNDVESKKIEQKTESSNINFSYKNFEIKADKLESKIEQSSTSYNINDEINSSMSKIKECKKSNNCKSLNNNEIIAYSIIEFSGTGNEYLLTELLTRINGINIYAKNTILEYIIEQIYQKNLNISKDLLEKIINIIDLRNLDIKHQEKLLKIADNYGINSKNITQLIRNIWIDGYFKSIEYQARFFVKYSKYLNENNFDKKIVKLLLKNDIKTAEKINNFLVNSVEMKTLNNDRILVQKQCNNIAKNAKLIDDFINFKNHEYGLNLILAKCMIDNKKSDQAIKFLSRINDKGAEIADEIYKIQKYAVVDLIYKKEYQKAYNILTISTPKSQKNFIDHQWYMGWINLEFLNKPLLAIKNFENIVDNVKFSISLSRGYYWLGRGHSKLARLINAEDSKKLKILEESKKYYKKAAHFPSYFYGQRAIEELGIDLSNEINQYFDEKIMKYKNNNNVLKIGLILNKFNNKTLSLEIIKSSFYELSKDEIVNTLYNSSLVLNKYDILPIARYATKFGVFIPKISYPKITYNVSNIASAIMRQESKFNSSAISEKNAIGLMQIIPSTAKNIAHKLGLSYSENKLFNHEYNIKIGSEYFKTLLNQFNGNIIMAIAAYNSGPAPVKKWGIALGEPRNLMNYKTINWIESINYYQTRDYVMRVLENYYMYNSIYS